MRLPDASVCDMASSIVLTASSASFGASWLWRALNSSMSCDLVMARISPLESIVLFLAAQLGLQQRAQVRRARAGARLGGMLLQGLGLFCGVLLLDARRDALALDVDGQHDGLDFIALLERLDRLLARGLPREVGEVHEAIDVARQADEHAEVGDRLDRAADLVALLVVHGELFP